MPARESLRIRSPLIVLGGLTVFAPLIDGGTTHFPVLIIRLVLIGAAAAWVVAAMKSGRITVPQGRLFLVMAVFGVWAVLSVVRSPYTAISLQWLLSILSYALMLLLVWHLVDSPKQVQWLITVILGMGLFEAALGIYQFVSLGRPRAVGTFFNPNFFASYESAVLALTVGLLCFRKGADEDRWERLFLWSTAGVVFPAFVLAQSRGAALALVASVGVVCIYRYGKVSAVVLLVALLAFAIIPNPLKQRILATGAHDTYAYTRLDIWRNSLQRIADHPWGVGLGLYKYASFQYRFPVEDAIARYGKRAESAHNEYLQVAAELGVAGLAIVLVGLGFLGWEIRETLSLELHPQERGAIVGLAGGVLGILMHAAVDSAFHEPALVLLLCLMAGLVLVLKRMRKPGSGAVLEVPFPYHPARMVLVGVLAIVLSLLAIRPAAAWYAFDRGEGEMTVGRMDQALGWFQWASRVDPGTSGYYEAAALAEFNLYRQAGEIRWLVRSIEDLAVGLDLNPLDGRLANRLGMLVVLLADRTSARAERESLLERGAAYFEQAMRLDPYSPFNYLELGKLRWAQGRADEAQTWLRKATSVEPNFLPARVYLAELSLKMGRRDVAAMEYAESRKIQERYRERALDALERQYLEVDLDPLKRSLTMAGAS